MTASTLKTAFETRTLVLDGALGTELQRRRVPTPAPLWSAAALSTHPHVVETIHREYVAAGADILVANTFRTNFRTLSRAGRVESGERLNHLAVELARRAAATRESLSSNLPVWVAASVAPVEDCYRPDLVPESAALRTEHRQMTRWLQSAHPDLIWIETMNTIREAQSAAQAAAELEMPFAVSFLANEQGTLLSGEALESAVKAVSEYDPLCIGLNCIPPEGATDLLPRLRETTSRPLAVYAHINNPQPIAGWSFSSTCSPPAYARHARRWASLGATIIGGCCGTTPAHIRAVRDAIS